MTPSLILDLVLAAILLSFAISGIRQGFVRSLCSLLAVFVAFFGAVFLAKTLTPYVAEIAAPHALPAIVERLEGKDVEIPSRDFSAQETGTLLENLGLPEAWTRIIQQNYAQQNIEQEPFASPSQVLAGYILNILTYGAVFVASFLILLMIWAILTRTLDLVAKLPVLNFLNRSLGALLGIAKGLLFLLILRWVLCDLTGQVSPEIVEQTYLFQLLSSFLAGTPLGKILL
ncbi:MAG: hypothetical protein H6Q61_1234 [Firmicutes bacterium]|nr:hypothetical protein [Bacillota bacterium]